MVLELRFASHIQHAIHKYFIWIVLLSYISAAIFPDPGIALRRIDLGTIHAGSSNVSLNIPSALLALLLFNAGLGTQARELKNLTRHPALLAGGILVNVLGPLVFVIAVSMLGRGWHNPNEIQQILTGLALIAAMPIAGASTAWSQNANGNLALSLGLILATTLLSPLTTPAVLHSVGFITTGDYAEDLHELASDGAGTFLSVWVILPSALGILSHLLLGEKQIYIVGPYIKLLNSAILIILNYGNAAISLPRFVAQPDLDFLLLILVIVGSLCFAMFSCGYFLTSIFRADKGSVASMMFGLGMNNNGAGLVLASLSLVDHPEVMLPIIVYNLIQHLFASIADKALSQNKGLLGRRHEEPIGSKKRN